MIPGMIFIAVVLLILVGLVATWFVPRGSWYDETLKRLWKDTKDDQTM